MTGVPAARIARAVDGCSVPVFRVPLASLARAYARLVGDGPRGESPAEASARRRIASAMASAPEMVAGTGRFTTDLMREFGGALVAKEGAEGVYAVGVPAALARRGGKAVGIAVKIADGAERGRDAVTVEVLARAGDREGSAPRAPQDARVQAGPQRARGRRGRPPHPVPARERLTCAS